MPTRTIRPKAARNASGQIRRLRSLRYAVFGPGSEYLGIVTGEERYALLAHDAKAVLWDRPGTPTIQLVDLDAWLLLGRTFTPGQYLPDDYCDPSRVAGRTVWTMRASSKIPVPVLFEGTLRIVPRKHAGSKPPLVKPSLVKLPAKPIVKPTVLAA